MKYKFGKAIIVLGILAGSMIFTNPNRKAYVDYAAVKLVKEAKNSLCKTPELSKDLGEWQDIVRDLSDGLSGICKGVIATGGTVGLNPIQNVIEQRTTRQNLLLLSIYNTELADREFKTLGAFGNFFTFSAK